MYGYSIIHTFQLYEHLSPHTSLDSRHFRALILRKPWCQRAY